jgi:N utilization substance protein B
MSSKTDSRERATLLLYEADSKALPISEVVDALEVAPDKYTTSLLDDYDRLSDRINELLERNTKGWKSDRLPGFDRAVLRMAITELARSAEVPVGTIISEAVELCEKYSTADSPRFVNGVLGTIAHHVRAVDLLKKSPDATDDKN